MSPARLPVAISPEIGRLASDVPAGVFSDAFADACEHFDRYVGLRAAELAADLRLDRDRPLSPAAVILERGWSAAGELALQWLFETLELYGMAEPGPGGWRITPPVTSPTSAATLAAATAARPDTSPAYRVFELCAGALESVLRGEASGEAVLFSPATLGLWFEYFSNANPLYAISNTLAAAAVSRVAPAGGRLIEVGGGGGSAAEATLGALRASGRAPSSYLFTELHPAFLRRGTRVVQAVADDTTQVTSARYDINLPPEQQGVPTGEADVVLAVNTVHLARDLVAALARLRSLLRPGGALVLGELLRPGPTAGVHIELPFTLLEAYRATPAADGLRPRPGFLAFEGWSRALARAGFARVTLLPAELARCLALYPGFHCGAITAVA